MTAAPLAGAIGTADDVKPYADTAEAYWAAGWRGVLPLPARAKTPPPGGYTGRTGVEPSWPDVYAWTEEHGAGNIALRLPLGVLGVDVDGYDRKPGAATLAALEAAVGSPIPPTVSVTARGPEQPSRIRLYRAELPEGRVWRDELEGLDAIHRGHRYMVAPPSVHPSGLRYVAYAPDTVTQLGRAIRLDELTALPAVWVEALSKPGDVLEPGAATDGHAQAVYDSLPLPSAEHPMCDRMREAAGRYLAHVAAGRAHQDGLHRPGDVLALVAFAFEGHHGARAALAQHAHAFIEARSVGRAEGQEVARREWWRMFTSAVGAVEMTQNAPRARCDCEPDTSWYEPESWPPIPFAEASTLQRSEVVGATEGSEAGDTPGLQEAFEQAVRLEMGRLLVRDEARRRVDVRGAETLDERVARLEAATLTSAQLEDLPPQDWLVEGWLPLGGLCLLVGASGCYKSFIGVDLAVRVALGLPWFGWEVKGGPVLYVAAEGAAGLKARIREAEVARGSVGPVDGLSVHPLPVQLGGDDWRAFVELVRRRAATLVVVDTLNRSTIGREENSNSEMRDVAEAAADLARETGATVLLVHHAGHEAARSRGASAIPAAADAIISVRRTADMRMTVSSRRDDGGKVKDGEELTSNLKVMPGPLGLSLVVANLEAGDALEVRRRPCLEAVLDLFAKLAERHGDESLYGLTQAEVIAGLRKGSSGLHEDVAGDGYAKATIQTAWHELVKSRRIVEGRSAARFEMAEAGREAGHGPVGRLA